MENKYEELAGCKDREEYLDQLAEENGVDRMAVGCLAEMLGEDEDFDGLVSEIEDFSSLGLM